MKKLLLSFVCLLTVVIALGQGVPRQMVAVEDGTGTWCTYCPGAAMGCDDLLSNGKFVAVIANHNGDSYANTYSNARNTMWGISAFPSVSFDGIQGLVGGSHTQSMYGNYLPKYNQCMAIPSPASLSMDVTNNGLDYTVVVTLTKEAAITSTNNILFFIVTQSRIQQNWQGQTHLEHVNRMMVPTQQGTPVSFTSGDVQTVTLNFTMNSAWPLIDCEFIALLQDMDNTQGLIPGTSPYSMNKLATYQCMKRGVVDLSVDFSAANTQVLVNETVNFTNATTGGYIGVPDTYNWQFPGGTPSTSTDKNPSVVYTLPGTYDVTLIQNRGGQIDTMTKTQYITANFGVGVNTLSNDQNCAIYPNPNNGFFTLEIIGQTGIYSLEVVNTLNSVMYQESNIAVNGKTVKNIDLSNLNSGMYFVILRNGEKRSLQKLFIK